MLGGLFLLCKINRLQERKKKKEKENKKHIPELTGLQNKLHSAKIKKQKPSKSYLHLKHTNSSM